MLPDSKHTEQIDDFSSLTHPYPAVRLLYSIEAMAEAVMDIFNFYGLDDNEAEKCMNVIVNDIYILIQSFMLITDSPIDIKKDERRVVECYRTLREIPYTDDYEKNEFLHLEPLSDSYLEIIDKFLGTEINAKMEPTANGEQI